MKKTTMEEMKKIVYTVDKVDFFGNPDQFVKDNLTRHEGILKGFLMEAVEKKAVLGFDIYRYSQYKDVPQALIPFILRDLLGRTIELINKYEIFLFGGNLALTRENHIDTGDGGFIIFETPLHAVCFSIHMSIVLKQFNTYIAMPLSREIVKEIDVRFAVTFDDVFFLEDNVYGSAIINNSRILSKDKLNRYLFDQSTNEWFLKNLNGIELIKVTNYDFLHQNEALASYRKPGLEADQWGVFSKYSENGILLFGITDCNTQKIGVILAKEKPISVFCLQVQMTLSIHDSNDARKWEPMVVTVGSLNATGLAD